MLRFFCGLVLLLGASSLAAQSYTVSSGALGSYSDLANPTQATQFENSYTGAIAPVNFSFEYFGQTYTDFQVVSNGYICMGGGMQMPDRTANHSRSPGNYIAALWGPFTTNSFYNAYNGYEWDASTGILKIEWKDCAYYVGSVGTTGVRMQMVLHTSTGVIEFHYAAPTSLTGQTSSYADTVAISSGMGTSSLQEVISGVDAGYVASDGSVTSYPAGRYIRFTPVGVSTPVSITTGTQLPDGAEGVAYSAQLQVSGGTGALTWTDEAMAPLPNGWSIDSTGTISAPAGSVTAGSYSFDITVTDSAATPSSDTETFDVDIIAGVPPLGITTVSPLPGGTEGTAYSIQLDAIGGTGNYTWTQTGLPSGWSLSSGGALDAPAASVAQGSFTFTATVDDGNSSVDRDFDVTIAGTGGPASSTSGGGGGGGGCTAGAGSLGVLALFSLIAFARRRKE